MPTPGLTIVGFGWSLLSLLAAGAVCTGYYLPYWLTDGNVSSYSAEFGCFRLCYPVKNVGTSMIASAISVQCGRYASFDEIPSVWWKICTVTVGIGCALATLIAFISLPAWCVTDVVSRASARMLGVYQLVAAILICVGCVLYPLGWDNNKWVKEACGRDQAVGPYVLGNCTIGWSFYLTLGGACALFICASLSAIAGRPVEWRRLVFEEEGLTISTMTPGKTPD